jgi:two-component system response regulator CpxR
MTRVLVIDDDSELTAMLSDYLRPEGFAVETAHDGEEGLAQALSGAYQLVILDVMLPRLGGLDVLRRLRAQSTCPVIMLTARGDEIDRIVGLEIGADDYLGKPFSARELLARMNAVLRRGASKGTDAPRHVLAVGDVVMDVSARTVHRSGQLLELTSAEFDILRMLLSSAGEVVTREVLFSSVLQRDYTALDRSVDNHVSSLRKKLGSQVAGTERIKSVRNIGYVYARTPRERPDA